MRIERLEFDECTNVGLLLRNPESAVDCRIEFREKREPEDFNTYAQVN